MPKVIRSQLQPYGVAVSIVASALLLTRLLQPLLTPTLFLLFYLAVILSALYGGMKPGLLATLLSALVCKYFFLAPVYSLAIPDLGTGVRLVVFLLVLLLSCIITSALRNARGRAEESLSKLRSSEERYRVLAENVPQLVWIARADGFVDYCNQRWSDYTGLDGDRSLGWDWQQVVHPDDIPSTTQQLTTGFATGNPIEVQHRLKRADGAYRWYMTRAVTLRNPNGEIVNWFGTCTDIHDQKRAEEELRQSEERLAFLSNASRLVSSSLDCETTLVKVVRLAVPYLADLCVVDLVEENQLPNRVAVAHIDPSKEEVLHELARRYPPVLNEVSPLQNALRSGRSLLLSEITESTIANYARDAEHLKLLRELGSHCSSMVVPLIARGRSLGSITFGTTESGRRYNSADLSLAEDLAHRIALAVDNARLYRASEEARKTAQDAEQALRHSESRFRRMVESNTIGIGFWERDGKITEANDALLQLVGYTQEDLRTGNLSWEQLTPSEYRSLDERALEEIAMFGVCTPFEKEYVRKDRRRVPIWLTGARFEKTPDSGVFFVLDLSDRKRAEQERMQLLEALESKQRLLEAVLQQMPAGVVVAEHPSGQLVLMNEQVLEIAGGSLSHVKGVKDYAYYQVFYPDGRLYTPEETPLARSLLTGEVIREEEFDVVGGDGIRRRLLGSSTPIHNTEGCIVAAVLTFYDITERKQTRKRIQLYADVVENVQVGIVVWQLENLEDPGSFRLITANLAACQFTGVDFEALIGTTMTESFPTLLETPLLLDYVEVVRTGRAKDLGEVRYGDERIPEGVFSLKAFPLPDRCLGLAFENITAAKQVEQALRDALVKLNFHVENTPLAVIERDRDFRITRWSHSAERIFGWQAEEAIGKGPNDFQLVFTEDIEAVNTIRTRLLSGLEKYNISRNRSYRKDGCVVHCEWYNSALLDESGNLVSVLSLVLDVTARERAEEALRQSEERFRQLAENLQDVFWMVDLSDRQLIYVSPAYEHLWGRSSESLYANHQSWIEAIHPQDRDRVKTAFFERVLEGEFNEEFRIIRPDGSMRWIRDRGVPVKDESGVPYRVAGIAEDITERKLAQEALRDALQKLTFHVENSPLAVVEWDREMRITRWSRSAQKVFGWKTEEVLGKQANDWRFVFDEDVEMVSETIERIVDSREPQILSRNRNYAKDGSVLHCEWYNSMLCDEWGNLVSVLSLVLDVTERKRAEEALQNSQERLELAQKVGKIGTCEWNLQTGELIWTEELEALYGLAPGRFGGKYKNWLETLHPDDRIRVEREMMLTVSKSIEFDSEFRILWSDGSLHWIAAKAQIFNDDTEKPWRLIGVNMDITERKHAEVERINLLERERAAREEAEAANRIKDEFLAVLSHELRSPLNPILGWSKLLQSRKFDEATTARALEIIERNAKLQIQLIEDLLDVSRILRGKLSLNVCPVNLVSTIEAALETVRLAASTKSIQIQTVFELNVGQVLGDSGRLQQVIWNLLSNAIKFTPNEGKVEVRLSAVNGLRPGSWEDKLPPAREQPATSYAQIQVSDRGKGINPDFLPYVFDHFRQENSTTTRLFGGLGLGLAIVRHLVELHGGTVRAESLGEGQGATFTVWLPLMATQPDINSDDRQYDDAPDLSGIRILVVDDEVDMREFLAFMLEDYGAQVTVVASASEALAALARVKPDVLLSDIGMPEVDGYMLIRQIRAMTPEQGGEIPAIALTAYAGESDQHQALFVGFQRHVAKPVEPAKLAAVIASLAAGNSNL